MSATRSGVISGVGRRWRSSIDIVLRMVWKLECISALTARAIARAAGSAGQTRAEGNFSFRYSMIARLSQIRSSPCRSAGTLGAAGASLASSFAVSGRRSRMSRSVNGWPVCFSTSQGRIDQDEICLSPI